MLFDHASCTVHQIIIINCPIFIITNVDLTLINKNKIVWGWGGELFFYLGIGRVSVFVDGFRVDVFNLLRNF